MKIETNMGPVDIPIGKIFGALILVVGLIVVSTGFYQVDAGQRGVLMTWGSPSMVAIEPGIHLKIPVMQTVQTMDVQTLKYSATAEAASKDLQMVKTQVTVNYHIDPNIVPKLYQNVGMNYEDKIIAPVVQETVKAVAANFDASELITKRPEVKAKVDAMLTSRLNQYNLIVEQNGVSLTDFDFSDEFNKAIEAKVTAVQQKQKAENDLARIEVEAKQKIAQSKADQMYATPNMIELKKIENQASAIAKWD